MKLFTILFFASISTFAADLNAHWQMPCQSSSDEDYFQPELVVLNNNWTEEISFYEEPGCKVKYLAFTLDWQAEVKNNFLDMNLRAFLVTPMTRETAEALNLSKYCGLIHWAAGKSQNVSGRLCNEKPVPAAGEKVYSIFELKNDQLRMGESSSGFDGKTPQSRHRILESEPYSRH